MVTSGPKVEKSEKPEISYITCHLLNFVKYKMYFIKYYLLICNIYINSLGLTSLLD